jgi:hypothetical protein
MPDIGEAILAGTKGFATGVGLMQAEERTELMQERLAFDKQLSDLNLQLQEKRNALLEQKNLIDIGNMAFTALDSIMGQEGIDPNRKDAIVKNFQKQFGVDINPYFVPNKDEKTGVVASYNLENIELKIKQMQQQRKLTKI